MKKLKQFEKIFATLRSTFNYEFELGLMYFYIQELNPEAEIINVSFKKSIISSKESFTYEQAQARIDDQ